MSNGLEAGKTDAASDAYLEVLEERARPGVVTRRVVGGHKLKVVSLVRHSPHFSLPSVSVERWV